MIIWAWLHTPHWIWWALYATTFATGSIVHLGRIYTMRGRSPAHTWLEAIGLGLWSLGAVLGGIAVGSNPTLVGTSAYVRACWVLGSLLLLSGGGAYMWRQWRMQA